MFGCTCCLFSPVVCYLRALLIFLSTLLRDKQHLVNLLALDGLYVAKDEVQAALAPIPERPRLILDLGENITVCLS